tara:strand:- start:274 stop:1326 length:1053 start_codon:yes stop_codon:yes gene_type:complete
MALSKIDTTNMIEDVPQSKLDNNINFRNIIINGDMSIAQRSTSESGVTSGGYYTIDRFRWTVSAGDTVTLSQSTDVPSGHGFLNSFKVDVTTADTSIGADQYAHISHRIEAQNLQYLKFGTSSAQTLTLSFWVKSTKTGTYCVSISKQDNTRYDYVAEYSISSSDTWEKKTITIAPDSNIKAAGGAINNDNGTGFNLKFVLAAGSNRQGTNETWNAGTAEGTSNQVNFLDSTSNDFYFTGVQLEAGTTASDFEFLPVDVNKNRCFRYFEKNSGDAYLQFFLRAQTNESTLCSQNIYFKQEMRANPTFTFTSSNYTPNNVDPAKKYIMVYGTTTSSGSTARINDYEADAEL